MKYTSNVEERGAIDGWMLSTIGLIVLSIIAGSFAIWGVLSYQEQKTGVDAKIDAAVALAKKEQADEDEKKFSEREKEPRREFVGPDDYGRLTFSYPKTWSAYVDRDITKGGSYKAYLHPVVVPPIAAKQQIALRVVINERSYDAELRDYEELVQEGQLKSSSFTANGENGTRFDGNFSDDIRGAAIILKIRDKTVIMRTDADVFKPDFEAIIKTISFNR